MIVKNAIFGKTENVTVCEMGTGDVWMLGSEKDKEGSVVLALKTVLDPQPINVKRKTKVKSFDEMAPELVFIFSKVESIDSLIGQLEDIKEQMQKK